MSSIEEEYISDRLKFFESSIVHAWVSWKDSDVVQVIESGIGFPLPDGEFSLVNLVDRKTLNSLQIHEKEISTDPTQIVFDIQYEGKKSKIDCTSVLKDGVPKSLWVMVRERDNSIYFLQNAAHDFRSPLGSIMGVVNLMQHSIQSDDKLDKEEVSNLLDMIKLNTDKALRLADEVMELAEMESKNYQLERSEVSLSQFVAHYLDTHRLLTLKKKITVKFNNQVDSAVSINESRMTRALDNVLSNAVKFSEVGSTIWFDLEEVGDSIAIVISDEGIGMSTDILGNIFTRFGKAKRNGLQGETSHGLGMSIVQQIMKLHDGDIKVISEEGKGTKVSLFLKKGL